jgi:hypothetical protein
VWGSTHVPCAEPRSKTLQKIFKIHPKQKQKHRNYNNWSNNFDDLVMILSLMIFGFTFKLRLKMSLMSFSI